MFRSRSVVRTPACPPPYVPRRRPPTQPQPACARSSFQTASVRPLVLRQTRRASPVDKGFMKWEDMKSQRLNRRIKRCRRVVRETVTRRHPAACQTASRRRGQAYAAADGIQRGTSTRRQHARCRRARSHGARMPESVKTGSKRARGASVENVRHAPSPQGARDRVRKKPRDFRLLCPHAHQ